MTRAEDRSALREPSEWPDQADAKENAPLAAVSTEVDPGPSVLEEGVVDGPSVAPVSSPLAARKPVNLLAPLGSSVGLKTYLDPSEDWNTTLAFAMFLSSSIIAASSFSSPLLYNIWVF